jgi:hypothetical protein
MQRKIHVCFEIIGVVILVCIISDLGSSNSLHEIVNLFCTCK